MSCKAVRRSAMIPDKLTISHLGVVCREGKMATHAVFLPGESMSRRLVGAIMRIYRESDTTAHTHTRVHTENQFLSKSLWLINVEAMTELENYHFPSPE